MLRSSAATGANPAPAQREINVVDGNVDAHRGPARAASIRPSKIKAVDVNVDAPYRQAIRRHLRNFAGFLNIESILAAHASGSLNAAQISEADLHRLEARLWQAHQPDDSPKGVLYVKTSPTNAKLMAHQRDDSPKGVLYGQILNMLEDIQTLVTDDSIQAIDKTRVLRQLAQKFLREPRRAIFDVLEAREELKCSRQNFKGSISEAKRTLGDLCYMHHPLTPEPSMPRRSRLWKATWHYLALKAALPCLDLKSLFEKYDQPEITHVLKTTEEKIGSNPLSLSECLSSVALKIAQSFHQRALHFIRNSQRGNSYCDEAALINHLKQEFGPNSDMYWHELKATPSGESASAMTRNLTQLAYVIGQGIKRIFPEAAQYRFQIIKLNQTYPQCHLIRSGPLRWLEILSSPTHCQIEPLRFSIIRQYQSHPMKFSAREWLELISNSRELDVAEHLDYLNEEPCLEPSCTDHLEDNLPRQWLTGKAVDLQEKSRSTHVIEEWIAQAKDRTQTNQPALEELADTIALTQGLPWWQ